LDASKKLGIGCCEIVIAARFYPVRKTPQAAAALAMWGPSASACGFLPVELRLPYARILPIRVVFNPFIGVNNSKTAVDFGQNIGRRENPIYET